MSQEKISRRAIADGAIALLGTPYTMHGRGEKLDCIAIIVVPFEQLGGQIADVSGYSAQPDAGELLPAIAARMDKIDVRDAGPGDVYAMCWGCRVPSHVCMNVGKDEQGNTMIVHATNDTIRSGVVGTVRMDALSGIMLRRVHSAWRFRDTVE